MHKIDQCKKWLAAHSDLYLDLIRIYLGTGLFVKAIYLLAHRDYLIQLIEQSGNLWFAPVVVAHYVILAHLVGGFLMAIGLLTRAAVLFQVPVLIGAVFYVRLPKLITWQERQDLEFSALVLFLLVVIGIWGAGRWSLDYYLSRKLATAPRVETAASSPR